MKKEYNFDEIPEELLELDSNQINPIFGQKAPKIKPKLDDTIPSILNLSSEMSTHNKGSTINESFNLDNIQIKKDCTKSNSIIAVFGNNDFIKSHYKAYSNELFKNPNIFSFIGQDSGKKNKHEEEDDNSSYYEGEINFDGVVNFWNEIHQEDDDKVKKKIFIEDENGNEKENEEDLYEGFNILNMLQKGKNKK